MQKQKYKLMCDFLTRFQQKYSQVTREERLRDWNGICMAANQHPGCGVLLTSNCNWAWFQVCCCSSVFCFIGTTIVEAKIIVFVIGIFVDNLLVTRNSVSEINKLRERNNETFILTDQGKLTICEWKYLHWTTTHYYFIKQLMQRKFLTMSKWVIVIK